MFLFLMNIQADESADADNCGHLTYHGPNLDLLVIEIPADDALALQKNQWMNRNQGGKIVLTLYPRSIQPVTLIWSGMELLRTRCFQDRP